MRYRRARAKGGTFFFTVVTHNRKQILTEPENAQLLRQSIKHVRNNHPFKIDAFVLLPDHLHCIWTLPDGDDDFSTRWRLIKSIFTRQCNDKYKRKSTQSRGIQKEQMIWQRRFWEHQITDDNDFKNHVDYIHYNPVKHQYAESPKDWIYSSFHKYVRERKYSSNWGSRQDIEFSNFIGHE